MVLASTGRPRARRTKRGGNPPRQASLARLAENVQSRAATWARAAPYKKTGAEIEKDLINSGKMPGLKQAGLEHREPGEDDEAGNKVHHWTALGRLLHGEYNAMNEEH
ncbi:hypothetical protein LTR16_003313 [Cryomyces antarcticus]|uniref:Uncharacterized protein n=1 Tax=Cryomyces antarcticus TaxID=329879 RepID=A0ABR0LY16_9PEZI|nr:hypothetical protein LTR16_003313 [Cryomyces antarcticus]